MSAFGGQIRFTGQPVERSWLETLGVRLRRSSCDGVEIAAAGPAGIVFQRQRAQADDHLAHSSDGVLLAFVGRFDNDRRELATLLGLSGQDAVSDSAILLSGLRRLGPIALAAKLYGDYVFAHWDPVTQQLSLARDAAGVRTVYFHGSRLALTFATDIGTLMEITQADNELDEDYIAGFLGRGPDVHLTPYRQIRPVSPAHVVTASRHGNLADHSAWALAVAPPPIVYRDDQQYEEHFRQLFADAVKARLRTSRPVVAELSGGLDSSSVVCVADHLLRAGAGPTPSLSTVTYLFDTNSTAGETPYLKAVESRCGRASHHICEASVPYFTPALHAAHLHAMSLFSTALGGYEHSVCQYMRSLGADLLLKGTGGDEMFCATNAPLPGLADLWQHGRFRMLHRELSKWSGALQVPYLDLLWQSFKGSVGYAYAPRVVTARRPHIPSWVSPRMEARFIEAHIRHDIICRSYPLPSQRDHASGYYSAIRWIANGHEQEFDPRHISFPCLHRPLVEFMHAIPFEQKLRCGQSRSLQRRALRDLLPELVAARRGKADATEPVMRGLQDGAALKPLLQPTPEVQSRGYVDINAVRATIGRVRAGIGSTDSLHRLVALECWLVSHRIGRTHTTHWGSTAPVAPAAAGILDGTQGDYHVTHV